jgi:hypothetical protein
MLVRLTLAATAASLLPAAASAAPVLEPLRPCYDAVEDTPDGREAVELAGTGFTPGALVDILVDGQVEFERVEIDPTGRLRPGTLPAPFVAEGQRSFTVTVTERDNPAQTVSATALVTALAVDVTPRSATPATRVRFKGSGFTADRPVYLHYVRRGRVRETVRLVRRPSGPCGAFDVRRRQFAFLPAVGRWELQFDQRRRYERTPDGAFLRLRVDVRRG